ncbi:LamG-like jellyroll fold domain-containing protein [Sulfurovum sp. ST-21]|uniref:LamG-like jellyroll fold domain-containing protein n=1 Tax=Sulfurovum indicum TaxID=2779528 RepID=A0A7M1S4G7_9BACT|nr:LamG-like jellyroll fold domain-containing protein [Sulfurovum indicum]QOR62248.1 hypothetical protein IMZ28_01875 [Sulfurovum indicum]
MNVRIIISMVLFIGNFLYAAPVAEYRMDECYWNGSIGEVNDSSGNGYNGTAIDATTLSSDAMINSSGYLRGVTNMVNLDKNVMDGLTDFTVMAWVKAPVSGYETILSAADTAGALPYANEALLWFQDATTVEVWIKGERSSGMTIPDISSGWHQIVWTRSGRDNCVYIDPDSAAAVPVCTTLPDTASGALTVAQNGLKLGVDQDSINGGFGQYLDGLLDEIKIFNTVLSVAEMADIYNNELSGKNYDGTVREAAICKKYPVLDYRMDECYWFDNAGGITEDVKDSGLYKYNATSYSNAQTDQTNSKVGFSGSFDGASSYLEVNNSPLLNFQDKMAISLWVYPKNDTDTHQIYIEKYYSSNTRSEGWMVWNYDDGGTGEYIAFSLNIDGAFYNAYIAKPASWERSWHYIAATYSNGVMALYIDSDTPVATKSIAGEIVNSTEPLRLGQLYNNYWFDGLLDEVKIYSTDLNDSDIANIRLNEGNGKNYDSSLREDIVCGATISAHTWELVGIPAELRTSTETVSSVFGDDMLGTYGVDWIVYRRDYSESNNSSWDTQLSETDIVEFGKGYWLGSRNSESWSVNDLVSVDYNASNGACTANRCVEVDLKSVSLDVESGDDLLGTGAHRYNMTGFVGKTAVDWADCRFVIDGVAYTPSAAYEAGYVEKQIWQYNPGDGSADANGHTACDDVTPGGCKLEPYKGFWIKLHASTKNKTVKLLIPQE